MTAEKATWRQQSRWECSLETTVTTPDGEVCAVVTDISEGGARLWCLEADRLAIDAEVTLALPERGEVCASVRYVAGSVVGLAFVPGTVTDETEAHQSVEVAGGAQLAERNQR